LNPESKFIATVREIDKDKTVNVSDSGSVFPENCEVALSRELKWDDVAIRASQQLCLEVNYMGAPQMLPFLCNLEVGWQYEVSLLCNDNEMLIRPNVEYFDIASLTYEATGMNKYNLSITRGVCGPLPGKQ
jgi:hypothetical protein